jgi:plastocyanin
VTLTMRRLTVRVLALLFFVGCADDPEATPVSVVDGPAPVVVLADEHKFVPATVSTRGRTHIRLDNIGALAHNWTILERPIETEGELSSEIVLASAEAEPGQSAVVDLDGLAPGSYQIICAIPGHFSAGMVGELVIGVD